MVFLSEIRNEWPWNKNAEPFYGDKEVFSRTIYPHDSSNEWRVKILPPMDGFVYIGVRVCVADQAPDYPALSRLVMGDTNRPVFGAPWDNTLSNNGEWKELGFPIMHRLLAITEDSMDLVLRWEAPRFGRVELLAQRLDDFLVDDSRIAYGFLNDRQQKVKFILTTRGQFFQPGPWDGNMWQGPIKILPMLYRVLHPEEPAWPDRQTHWPYVELNTALDDVPPFPAPKEDEDEDEDMEAAVAAPEQPPAAPLVAQN